MFLQIDLASDEPIYRQIRTQVVHAVATGELNPGDQLPSVRALASDLGVNMHTVNKAYAVLRDEGYVIMRGRSGACIADTAQALSPARTIEAQERMAEDMLHLALEFKARGGSHDAFMDLAAQQAAGVFRDGKSSGSSSPGTTLSTHA